VKIPGILFQWDEHLFPQEERCRFSTCSSSINPTFQVTLLLEGYSTSASCDALFFLHHLDLPEACFCYFSTQPPFVQHTNLPWRCVGLTWFRLGRRFFKQWHRVIFTSSPWTRSPEASCSPSYTLRRIFFFGSPCTLRDLTGTMSSLRLNMTLSQPLHLHVDRGLERHGYPWVPTDQGPGGPCQVDPTCQKPHRPASGPGDLIHNPKTSDDLIQTPEGMPSLWRKLLPRSQCDAASRSVDRGILSVITEGALPNL
jgi:hypothetical protein